MEEKQREETICASHWADKLFPLLWMLCSMRFFNVVCVSEAIGQDGGQAGAVWFS